MQKLCGFVIAMVFCTCAFAHAYYFLGVRQVGQALVRIIRLGWLGDFDIEDLEGVDPSWKQSHEDASLWEKVDPEESEFFISVHVLFIACALAMTILMINLLIGIMTGAYDKYEDLSLVHFIRERARIVTVYYGRVSFYSRLRTCCWSRRPKVQPQVMSLHQASRDLGKSRLVICQRSDLGNEREVRSHREFITLSLSHQKQDMLGTLNFMKTDIASRFARQDHMLSEVSASLKQVEARLARLS